MKQLYLTILSSWDGVMRMNRMILKVFSTARQKFYLGCLLSCALGVLETHASGSGGMVDKNMVFFTWVTFGLLLLLLYKFAWNPILAALDKRESNIRDSVENAATINDEMAKLEATKEEIIGKANEEAKGIVAAARKGAVEAARVIENDAKEKSRILVENATRELKAEEEKARAILRKESADLAIALASKLIDENLDDEKNRLLTDKVIKEMA